MKEQPAVSMEKLVEEGFSLPNSYETKRRLNGREQLIQCLKLILYVELTLLFGWGCYTVFQYYHDQPAEAKVEVTSGVEIPASPFEREPVKSTDNPTVALDKQLHELELALSRLNNFLVSKNVEELQKTDLAGSVLEDVFHTTQTPDSETDASVDSVPETGEDEVRLAESESATEGSLPEDSEEPIRNLQVKDFSESKNKGASIAISLPFLWTIHGLEVERNSDERTQSVDRSVDEESSTDTSHDLTVDASVKETDSEGSNYDSVSDSGEYSPYIWPGTESREDTDDYSVALSESMLLDTILSQLGSLIPDKSESEQDLAESFDSTAENFDWTAESFDSTADSVGNMPFLQNHWNAEPIEILSQDADNLRVTEDKVSTAISSEEDELSEASSVSESRSEQEVDEGEKNSREGFNPGFHTQSEIEALHAKSRMTQSQNADQVEKSTERESKEKTLSDSTEAQGQKLENIGMEDAIILECVANYHSGHLVTKDDPYEKYAQYINCMNRIMSKRETRSVGSQEENSNEGYGVQQELLQLKQNLLNKNVYADPEAFKNKINRFVQKMESLSAHIDRLHTRYLLVNTLDDDYISREIPEEILDK